MWFWKQYGGGRSAPPSMTLRRDDVPGLPAEEEPGVRRREAEVQGTRTAHLQLCFPAAYDRVLSADTARLTTADDPAAGEVDGAAEEVPQCAQEAPTLSVNRSLLPLCAASSCFFRRSLLATVLAC